MCELESLGCLLDIPPCTEWVSRRCDEEPHGSAPLVPVRLETLCTPHGAECGYWYARSMTALGPSQHSVSIASGKFDGWGPTRGRQAQRGPRGKVPPSAAHKSTDIAVCVVHCDEQYTTDKLCGPLPLKQTRADALFPRPDILSGRFMSCNLITHP